MGQDFLDIQYVYDLHIGDIYCDSKKDVRAGGCERVAGRAAAGAEPGARQDDGAALAGLRLEGRLPNAKGKTVYV